MKNNQQSTNSPSVHRGGARRAGAFQAERGGVSEATSSLEIIDKYLADNLLYLDATQSLVVISPQLHMSVMDNEVKASRWPWRWLIRHGWVERDKRYRRLMKAIKIYLELPRGTMQGQYEERLVTQGMDRAEAHREATQKYPIHDGPLHFIVADPTNPSQPMLLGTYDHDRIALVEASSTQPEEQYRSLTDK